MNKSIAHWICQNYLLSRFVFDHLWGIPGETEDHQVSNIFWKKKIETYSGKCEFAKYSGESEFETLQVKLLQELCTKQAEGRMSVVVISDQEKFR